MPARYLNRSAMRMYEFCYFLFLARENLKMIKRNFTLKQAAQKKHFIYK
jgi:hypothetical protein